MRAAALAALLVATACSSRPAPAGTAASTPPPAAPAPSAAAAPGRVVTAQLQSAALGVTRSVVVYLPGGYDADAAKRWPVVYYLHGLGGDERDWIEGGQLAQRADALGFGAIVVMPDGDDGFYADSVTPVDYDACLATGAGLFTPQREPRVTCVRTPAYERYMVQDLIGWVDATYRTIATRDGRGIAGLSMGGFGALQLALRHQDLFAAAASHSGIDALLYAGPVPYAKGTVQLVKDPRGWGAHVGRIGPWVRAIFGPALARWQAHDPASLATALAPGKLALYLDCGTEDEFMLQHGAAYLHDVLADRGIEHTYFIGPGQHDFAFWGPRLPHSLAFFREHLTAAH